jgi:hypothetical protein
LKGALKVAGQLSLSALAGLAGIGGSWWRTLNGQHTLSQALDVLIIHT